MKDSLMSNNKCSSFIFFLRFFLNLFLDFLNFSLANFIIRIKNSTLSVQSSSFGTELHNIILSFLHLFLKSFYFNVAKFIIQIKNSTFSKFIKYSMNLGNLNQAVVILEINLLSFSLIVSLFFTAAFSSSFLYFFFEPAFYCARKSLVILS